MAISYTQRNKDGLDAEINAMNGNARVRAFISSKHPHIIVSCHGATIELAVTHDGIVIDSVRGNLTEADDARD